jgi:hypothetical protein
MTRFFVYVFLVCVCVCVCFLSSDKRSFVSSQNKYVRPSDVTQKFIVIAYAIQIYITLCMYIFLSYIKKIKKCDVCVRVCVCIYID